MKVLIGGEFVDSSDHYDVKNPYNRETVDTVPICFRPDVDKAVEAANAAKFLKPENHINKLLVN